MWCHMRKGTLLRNKYLRPWSEAAHDVWCLIRAYDISCSWAFEENIFCRSMCNVNKKYYPKRVKTADLGWHCSFRNKVPFSWWRHICFICDVIRENPAYWGANSAFLDQPFRYICIHRLFLNCADSEKSVSADTIMWKKSRLWSNAIWNTRCLIRACSFCVNPLARFSHMTSHITKPVSNLD